MASCADRVRRVSKSKGKPDRVSVKSDRGSEERWKRDQIFLPDQRCLMLNGSNQNVS